MLRILRPAGSPARPDSRETASPGASPARLALADHIADIDRQRALIARLRQPAEAAADAERRETEAIEAIEAVAMLEDAGWRTWLASGTGPVPAPLTGEREAAVADAETAHAEAAVLRDRAAALQPDLEAEHGRYCEMVKQTPPLVQAVLRQEAQIMASRYHELAREAFATEAAIFGIGAALHDVGDVAGRGFVNRLLAGDRDSLKLVMAASATRWRALGDRLSADAEASVAGEAA